MASTEGLLFYNDMKTLQPNLFGYEDMTPPPPTSQDKYTSKVKAMIYTPRAPQVGMRGCYDRGRYDELVRRIERSGVSDEEKDFLMLSASRHIAFNYEKIADYYAVADGEMQELMEESALVIVDFDSALENGFVVLNDRMKKLYEFERDEKLG